MDSLSFDSALFDDAPACNSLNATVMAASAPKDVLNTALGEEFHPFATDMIELAPPRGKFMTSVNAIFLLVVVDVVVVVAFVDDGRCFVFLLIWKEDDVV